jgi:hypothetical protein
MRICGKLEEHIATNDEAENESVDILGTLHRAWLQVFSKQRGSAMA